MSYKIKVADRLNNYNGKFVRLNNKTTFKYFVDAEKVFTELVEKAKTTPGNTTTVTIYQGNNPLTEARIIGGVPYYYCYSPYGSDCAIKVPTVQDIEPAINWAFLDNFEGDELSIHYGGDTYVLIEVDDDGDMSFKLMNANSEDDDIIKESDEILSLSDYTYWSGVKCLVDWESVIEPMVKTIMELLGFEPVESEAV